MSFSLPIQSTNSPSSGSVSTCNSTPLSLASTTTTCLSEVRPTEPCTPMESTPVRAAPSATQRLLPLVSSISALSALLGTGVSAIFCLTCVFRKLFFFLSFLLFCFFWVTVYTHNPLSFPTNCTHALALNQTCYLLYTCICLST